MKLIQASLIAASAAAAGAAAFAVIKIHRKLESKKAVQLKAREEFAASAAAFSGLYEPLYMMGKGSLKFRAGVIGDWETRTLNLANALNYREIWKSSFSDYQSWDKEHYLVKITGLLSFVFAAGVCRDTSDQIIVDSTTYKKYSTFDDEMIEAGNPARVKTPYWFIGDTVLEKGVIERM